MTEEQPFLSWIHAYILHPLLRSRESDHLAGAAGGQATVRPQVDAVVHRAYRAVGHREQHAAGVVTAERVSVPPLRVVVRGAVQAAGVGGDSAGADGAVGVGPAFQAALTHFALADHEGAAGAVGDLGDADALAGAHDDAVAVGAAVILAGQVGVAPARLGPPPAGLAGGRPAPVGAEVAAVVGHPARQLAGGRVAQIVVVGVRPRPLGRDRVAGAPKVGDLVGDHLPGCSER